MKLNFLYRLLQTSPNTITNENQTHLRRIFSGTDGFRGGGGRRRREGAGEWGEGGWGTKRPDVLTFGSVRAQRSLHSVLVNVFVCWL